MVRMVHAYSLIFYKFLTIMHFYFNIMHKSMSNFAYKYEIKKFYGLKYVLDFIPHYIVDEILSFINDEIQY